MRLNLSQIKDASLCFKRFRYSKGHSDSRSIEAKTAERVIQKCYTRATESGFRPDWRTLVGWVDKLIFASVDVDDSEEFQRARQSSEHTIAFLSRWYNDTFLHDNNPVFSNIGLGGNVAGLELYTTIPMVKATEPPVIVSVSNVVQKPWDLYNDLEVRGQCWLVAESLRTDAVAYQRLTIGPKGGITDMVIYNDDKCLRRAHRMIRHVAESIAKGADYPIVSERCNGCEFKRRCSI